MEITALNNDNVKFCVKLQKKKFRDETGLFLLEGSKSVLEAVEFGVKLKSIFVLKEKAEKYNFSDVETFETTTAVLKKISTTDSAPEIVGVAYQKEQNFDVLKTAKKVVLLENVSDVGNLGTVIRSSVAFNIDVIILYGQSVDIYNPKCVRSTVGNLWKTNILEMNSVDELDKYFKDFEKVATLPKNDSTVMFNNWTPNQKTLVMFGSEADGLSDELIKYSTMGLTIEMNDKVESLNLGVSASIVMHKLGF